MHIIRKIHLFIIRIIKHNFLGHDICRHRILVLGNVSDSLNVPNNKTCHDVKPLFLKVTTYSFCLKRSCSHCSGIYYDPTPTLQKGKSLKYLPKAKHSRHLLQYFCIIRAARRCGILVLNN